MTYPSESADYINAVTIPVSRSPCRLLTFEVSNIFIDIIWYQIDDLVNLYLFINCLWQKGGNSCHKYIKITRENIFHEYSSRGKSF